MICRRLGCMFMMIYTCVAYVGCKITFSVRFGAGEVISVGWEGNLVASCSGRGDYTDCCLIGCFGEFSCSFVFCAVKKWMNSGNVHTLVSDRLSDKCPQPCPFSWLLYIDVIFECAVVHASIDVI